MKRIIDGKRYDTATAKVLGFYEPHAYTRQFDWYEEYLYQKRTGEFFLYGHGNAASRYAESMGNNQWESGEKILPLDYAAAKSWAEKHLDPDDYEKIFIVDEDEVETGTKVKKTVVLDTGIIAAAERKAIEEGLTFSALIEKALKKLMEV